MTATKTPTMEDIFFLNEKDKEAEPELTEQGKLIVNAIIKYVAKENEDNFISTTKVNKLAYYYYAWSVANDLDPLFEDPYTWEHGPVIKSVYDYVDIIKDQINKFWIANLESNNDDVLELVLNNYGYMTKYDLSFLSHSELPYIDAIRDKAPQVMAKISRKDVKNYYLSLV